MNTFTPTSAGKPSSLRKFYWRGGAAARCLAGIALAGAAATGVVQAAPAIFGATPTDANFATGTNWSTGAAPGVNDGTTVNTDTATFSAALTNSFGTASNPLVIDLNRNLQNITFSGATASAYVIGATGGNALLLTSGGTISSTAANTQTVNAPLVLEPASATTAAAYTFSSSTANAANVLNIGGPITLGTTSATDTLTLTGTNTGANTLGGTINAPASSAAGGLILTKTGAGAWTFGGSGTSALAKGELLVNGGTFNFGGTGGTPTLSINGQAVGAGNVGVFVTTGNFNMNAGTLTVGAGLQGLVLNGANTYTQTGGAFNTNGLIEFGNAGNNSVVNVSGGTLTSTLPSASNGGGTELAVRGTGVVATVSGTGVWTTPVLTMSSSQLSGGTAGSTFNLGTGTSGGTLVVGQIRYGTNGNGTFNFTGGTLQASASSATFMIGLTTANVQAGGAVINTNGFNDTVGQNLVGSTGDGGLTKSGAGTLTLTGTNTYTGGTTITGGTLVAGHDGALGSGTVTVTAGALTLTGGATNNYIGDLSNLILTSSNAATPFVTLNFTGTDIIGGLSFDNGATFVQAGTYGAAGSGALFTNTDFTGTGTLTILAAAPEPSQFAAFGLGLFGLGGLALRARKRSLTA